MAAPYIPSIQSLAESLGDIELDQPLEFETYNELTYLMTLVSRAQSAIGASVRSLEARKVPLAHQAATQAYWALEDLYAAAMPLILAHAVERDAVGASK